MTDLETTFTDMYVPRLLAAACIASDRSVPALSLPEFFNAADFLLGASSMPDSTTSPKGHAQIAEVTTLDKATARIANLLVTEMGIVPGNRVLFCAWNSPALLAAMLGALRAGAILVPTVPFLKETELSGILAETRPDLALSGSSEKAVMQAAIGKNRQPMRHISLHELMKRSEPYPDQFRGHRAFREDPALILFTSGTTGAPKAAVHGHVAIAAIVKTFGEHIFRARPDDLVIGSPSLAFAYGLGLMMACPLAAGASVVFPHTHGINALAESLNCHPATMLVTVPTGYRKLLARNDWRSPALRRCFSAGEPLPDVTRKAWRERTGLDIVDLLGSSELFAPYISASEESRKDGTLGLAVPGYQLALVSQDGTLSAPPGTGRLAVLGPTGCRYLDPEVQSRSILDGWTLTGDICRIAADGYVTHLGRADDMIVTSGYNVAVVEVENALLSHPAVEECAVVGLPDPARGQRLAAAVVLAAEARPGEAMTSELIAHVQGTLARFKAPREIVFIDSLPRTANGKVRRFELMSCFGESV